MTRHRTEEQGQPGEPGQPGQPRKPRQPRGGTPGIRPLGTGDPDSPGRRRRPARLSDLLPALARDLGLQGELAMARGAAVWDALIAERVPPAVGACRLVGLEPEALVVTAREPIVAAELRMRAAELLDAFAQATGTPRRRFVRLVSGNATSGPGPGVPRV
jgi:hypothetical protein